MGLEWLTLAASEPGENIHVNHVNVEVLTLSRVYNAGNMHQLIWQSDVPPFPVNLLHANGITNEERETHRKFIEPLKEGDKFIVVYSGGKAAAIYGPIDERRLLIPPYH